MTFNSPKQLGVEKKYFTIMITNGIVTQQHRGKRGEDGIQPHQGTRDEIQCSIPLATRKRFNNFATSFKRP